MVQSIFATGPCLVCISLTRIATYRVNGVNYVVTANEGILADWGIAQVDGDEDSAGDPLNLNMEEFRVKDLTLDPEDFRTQPYCNKKRIWSFKGHVSTGRYRWRRDYDALYANGGRSFSIWNGDTGEQVFDSGSEFERITALKYGVEFNNGHDEVDPDGRSDAKGPEPEALALGKVNGHTYAFIGLERMGGIFVYDISNPYAPVYVQYTNHRDLTLDPEVYHAEAGDLGPEGFKFVDAAKVPLVNHC